MQIFSAANPYTATTNSKDIGTADYVGAIFFLHITNVSGTSPTMTIKFQYKCQYTGNYIDIPGAAFAAKTAAGSDSLTIYPGVVATANRSVALVLPNEIRAVATIGGTTPSFTFSMYMDTVGPQ